MNAIVSVTRDWGIGKDGGLLVENRRDLRRFASLTAGGTLIMGRATFESLPGGPLKGRRNIVLSRSDAFAAQDIEVAHDIAEAEALVRDVDPDAVWLIGGAQVYRQLIGRCARAYVTRHDIVVEADAYFPDLDGDEGWELLEREGSDVTPQGVAYEFLTYAQRA